MNVPLVDLGAQYEPLKGEILRRVGEILDGMQLFLGPNVQAFEEEFARYQEVEHAVGVSDGTAALQLALIGCGVGHGDGVITASEQRAYVVDVMRDFCDERRPVRATASASATSS